MRKLWTSVALLGAMQTANAVTIEPAPATLVIASPGYVQLDGHWYDFDVSAGQLLSFGTRVLAQPSRDGFFMDGFLGARSCQRQSGGDLLADGLLEHAETSQGLPDGAIPLYRRVGPVRVLASVGVRSCLGEAPVLQLSSIHGDLICQGEIAAPYTVEECPPGRNPLIIFDSGFGQTEPGQ